MSGHRIPFSIDWKWWTAEEKPRSLRQHLLCRLSCKRVLFVSNFEFQFRSSAYSSNNKIGSFIFPVFRKQWEFTRVFKPIHHRHSTQGQIHYRLTQHPILRQALPNNKSPRFGRPSTDLGAHDGTPFSAALSDEITKMFENKWSQKDAV